MSNAPTAGAVVTFWGTRGSIATPGQETTRYGGNTACLQVSYGTRHLILDAGTGIRELGKELSRTQGPHDHHIFLSHTHWDHIQGLPFFLPAYQPDASIHFYGSPNKEALLENILTGQMNLKYFPVQMQDLPARLHFHELDEKPLTIGPLQIRAEEQPCHPGGSLRFRVKAGEAVIVYATDVEIDGMMAAPPDSPEGREYAAYCRGIAGADLLIADAQYTRATYVNRAGWGHSTVEAIIATAAQQQVKRLAIFHHDPDNTDAELDLLEDRFRQAAPPMEIFWARERDRILLQASPAAARS